MKPCTNCGRYIVFGIDRADGQWKAFDNTVPIYRIRKGKEVEKADGDRLLVPHAFVCPAVKKVLEIYSQPERHFSDPKGSDE